MKNYKIIIIFLIISLSFYILLCNFNKVLAISESLQIEKKFNNLSFVIPKDYFKIEAIFSNNSFKNKNNIIEKKFKNLNLILKNKLECIPYEFVNINNSNLQQNNLKVKNENLNHKNSNLSSLILLDQDLEYLQALQLNKFYNFQNQQKLFIPSYISSVDFANELGLTFERNENDEGLILADHLDYNERFNLFNYSSNTIFDSNYLTAFLSESETSIDISELDPTFDTNFTLANSLTNINEKFELKDNNLANLSSNSLKTLETNKIQFNKIHVVQPKDNIVSIANEYNITVSELMNANNLNSMVLIPGSILMVPDKEQNKINITNNDENVSLVNSKNINNKNIESDNIRLLWPSSSSRRITSSFGIRIHPIYRIKRFHNGIDIAARYGSPIKAAHDGVVIFSGWKSYYGKTVIIKHSKDLYTLYAHCAYLNVKKGDIVKRGSIIAKVGSSGLSTGPHIHFSVQKGGRFVNPLKYF